MRVTSGHIIALAAGATQRAQGRVADAAEAASSGLAVQRASDDPVAWVAAQRMRVRVTIAEGAKRAIEYSQDQLAQTDSALATIQDAISRARVLAVQGSSETYTAVERSYLGNEVASLFTTALRAANTTSVDGEFLLAGGPSTAQPFDPTGSYLGDAQRREVPIAEQALHAATVPGSMLTAANGVDVLPLLGRLSTALGNNDPAAVRGCLDDLRIATSQLSSARSHAGVAISALGEANAAREQLTATLTEQISKLVEADGVKAASDLALATQTLDISRAVSSHLVSALAPAG
jgi:flagellar hook-associated protein 3 FlgL